MLMKKLMSLLSSEIWAKTPLIITKYRLNLSIWGSITPYPALNGNAARLTAKRSDPLPQLSLQIIDIFNIDDSALFEHVLGSERRNR